MNLGSLYCTLPTAAWFPCRRLCTSSLLVQQLFMARFFFLTVTFVEVTAGSHRGENIPARIRWRLNLWPFSAYIMFINAPRLVNAYLCDSIKSLLCN